MSALIIADLHLHHLPNWRYEWCESFVDQILTDDLYKHDHLYLLGDALEVRDNVPSKVLNQLIKLVKYWPHGDVVWLSGQHDSFVPNKATLFELDSIQLNKGSVYIVDREIKNIHGLWFVPYQRKLESYYQQLSNVPDNTVVLTHMPLKEVLENIGVKDPEAVCLDDFRRFKKVISGDIHKYWDGNNFSYVGAPSQRDWRDKDVKGQVGVLIDDQLTRLPTTHPQHIIVDSDAQIPAEGEYIVKSRSMLNKNHVNVLDDQKIIDHKILSFNLPDASASEDLIAAYVNKSGEADQATLINLGKSLLKGNYDNE